MFVEERDFLESLRSIFLVGLSLMVEIKVRDGI